LFGVFDLMPTMNMYWVVLAVFVIGFLIVYRTIHSPFGQVLKAIRENEPRAVSLGYRPEQYKLIAFVISAALSGLAGGTKAIVFQLASLTDVHWTMSGEIVLMTLLGGMGTVFGPVVGAFILIMLENTLSQLGDWLTVVQGAIFVVCVLLFRRGVVGDQKERGQGGYTPGERPMDVEALHSAIRHIPKPVIAMVNGFAIGGGHVLHVLCDLSIAADTAIFGQTGPRVGSVDAGHGTGYLARVVGEKKAREIWYLCRQYTAQQALEMGLVNKVVPFAQLRTEVEQWCRELLEKSPTALAMAKQSFNIDSETRGGVAELAPTE